MSKNISLDEIKEFWPDKAPDINIVQKYIKKYENEKFINVMPLNTLISTKDVRGSNFCNISVCESSSPDTVILFSTLDNLIKGSSGQAIQNANLMFNLDESLGLLTPPIYP